MLDEWLTGMLGYPVYNSAGPPESDERSLTYIKVRVEDVAAVNELTGLGFRVVDVGVQFSRTAYPYSHHYEGIGWADKKDHPALLAIAESCFSHSRFHRDGLTMLHANRIKREWLRNCLNGERGLEVLVALNEKKKPVGFLAVNQDRDARVVDLLGVKPHCWGRDIGRKLLTTFAGWNGERELLAGTSLSNTAAVRLYESCGFKLRSAFYVLHLHRGVQ